MIFPQLNVDFYESYFHGPLIAFNIYQCIAAHLLVHTLRIFFIIIRKDELLEKNKYFNKSFVCKNFIFNDGLNLLFPFSFIEDEK